VRDCTTTGTLSFLGLRCTGECKVRRASTFEALPLLHEELAGKFGQRHAADFIAPDRSDRNPVRSSSQKSFGCSQAAKCPPLGSRL
jgi:hypothetical protein